MGEGIGFPPLVRSRHITPVFRKLISGRWRTRYFSWRSLPLAAGLLLLAGHFALLPLSRDARLAATALRFLLLYAGLVLAVWGFTGHAPVLKTVHKVLVVSLCLVPTIFASMTFVFMLITILVGLATESAGLWAAILRTAAPCFALVCIALAAWWSARKIPLAAYEDYPYDIDPRSRFVAVAVLLLGFGFMGFHRFYCRRIATGAIWFLTGALFGIGYVLDIALLLTGKFKDGDGKPVVARRRKS